MSVFYLCQGLTGGVAVFQLHDDGWLLHVLSRHEHQVGKAGARLVLAVEDVVAVGVVVGYGEHAGHGVLVAVLDEAGICRVGLSHHACHRLFVAAQGGLEKALRLLEGAGHLFPLAFAYGVLHLLHHLHVGYVALLRAAVIAQVAQVYEHGEHVVAGVYLRQVVVETPWLHVAALAGNHAGDVVLQTLIVQLYVGGDGVGGARLAPVVVAPVFPDGRHHRVGVEHRWLRPYQVAVVPFLQLVEVHGVTPGQLAHLFLGKAEKLGHAARRHHGVLLEIVERRLRVVLLDGQDSRHVDPGEHVDRRDVLEHAAQHVHVLVHHLRLLVVFAADGVPLVDDHNEALARGGCYAHDAAHQVVGFTQRYLGIGRSQVGLHLLLDMLYYVVVVVSGDKLGHVHIDDGVLVQMFLKRRVAGYLEVLEEAARVARVVVVGSQHLSRHRLAEAAAARHAAHLLLSEQRLVHHGYQPRLVHVLRVAYLAEAFVTLINEYAHLVYFRFTDLLFISDLRLARFL